MSKPRHAPPPTRFGPAPVQPKQSVSPSRHMAPPPTRFAPTAAPLQAKPGGGPLIPLAVIQPMMGNDDDDDEGIGKRVARVNKADRFKSKRLKNKYGGGTGKRAPRYAPYVAPNEWNNKRPAWENATWTALASNTAVIPFEYSCVACGATPIYRKKDRPRQARATDATIDHKTDWWNYITSNAEPDDQGIITPAAAKAAYNDLNNLQIMCRRCNAAKNGPRGVHD